jgi:hypothetical protein
MQQDQSQDSVDDGSLSNAFESSLDMPIALRKGRRVAATKSVQRYGFENDISNYISYEALSPSYRAFVAALQAVIQIGKQLNWTQNGVLQRRVGGITEEPNLGINLSSKWQESSRL